MTGLDQNFRDLLNCLNSAGVRYLVIGGYAVNFHGHHRNTKGLDVWIATDPENAKRVAAALVAFGFSRRAARSSLFEKRDAVYTFGREPFRVDLLTQPSAVEFEACYARRVEADVDGLRFPLIALEDLLTNKVASGRLQDIADVHKLRKKKPGAKRKTTRRRRAGPKGKG
jgi:predicted nucleotidyltransferase